MNTRSPMLTLLPTLSLLSDTLVQAVVEQEVLITHIDKDHGVMEDMRLRINELSDQVDNLETECANLRSRNATLSGEVSELLHTRTRCQALEEDVRRLQGELFAAKNGGCTQKEVADAYMAAGGTKVWERNKIECVQEVRSRTQWGLKEAKNYCESYMAAGVEETPSGTQRSAQLVAVG